MSVATVEQPAWLEWIRPWYPAGQVGHIFADCPDLLGQMPAPVEGAGWLDPFKGPVCGECVKRAGIPSWQAECDTCCASMAEEWADHSAPFTKADAELWRDEHRCQPSVRLIEPYDARKNR